MDQNITITAPKVTVGEIHLPPASLYRSDLTYKGNKISCYLYVDQMVTDIVSQLSLNRIEIDALKKENEKLIKRNLAKSDFLAHMSHELRTPLNGMIGIVDLVKKTSISEYQRRQLETVAQSGDLLLAIINEILEFSKIEKGKMEFEKKEFELRSSIESLVGVIAPQVFTKGLDFSVSVPDLLPKTVFSDETKIKQVLTNLTGQRDKVYAKRIYRSQG